MTLFNVGDRVITREGTGTVVGGTMWTANLKNGQDCGDRTVQLDTTGERLVFESFLMRPLVAMIELDDAKVARLNDREVDELYLALSLVESVTVGDYRSDVTHDARHRVLREWHDRGMMARP